MKSKLIVVFLFSFINSSSFYSSNEIWNKALGYIKEGTMLLQNKGYFIFDESNYTKLNLNDTKMQFLYKRLERLFIEYGIANYIFILDSLSESTQLIKFTGDDLRFHISKDFKIDISNSVITIFSMNTRRIGISLGFETKQKITDSNAESIIDDLGPYLRSKDYYNALIKLIDDINFYYNFKIFHTIIIISLCISFGGVFCYFKYLHDDCNSSGSFYSGGYDSGFSGGGDFGGGGCDGGASGGW